MIALLGFLESQWGSLAYISHSLYIGCMIKINKSQKEFVFKGLQSYI